MPINVRLSENAVSERAKLPPRVQAQLDKRFEDLARTPRDAGYLGTDRIYGLADDGSRFHVEFIFEYRDDPEELVVLLIDVFSY